MKIEAVSSKNKLNMFIRNSMCFFSGHHFTKSCTHYAGGMYIMSRTYCNRCGIVTKTKVMGGL